jgi:hypothetical protein
MPDESPIDLDEHAAMIAYDVERQGSYAAVLRQRGTSIKRREATIEVTRNYVRNVRRFLNESRKASSRLEG